MFNSRNQSRRVLFALGSELVADFAHAGSRYKNRVFAVEYNSRWGFQRPAQPCPSGSIRLNLSTCVHRETCDVEC